MQRLEISGAVRPLQWSLGVKGLIVKFSGALIQFQLRRIFGEDKEA